MKLAAKILEIDILVIGGGTAGCYAAITAAELAGAKIIVAEKANIRRSGCLAAGVNALNAYIAPGRTPEDYLAYVRSDSSGIVREDLVYSLAVRLNAVTDRMASWGLVIQKDEQGRYALRGNRNIKINGENIKEILAENVRRHPNISVLNRVYAIDYILKNGAVTGAYCASLDESILYVIAAKAVICATGGASGLYRPNNPGFSRHKMWYCPFNTGAGYAMGIRAGAEMTTFEMRFIALRCKDTLAPTGTIAQGVSAPQVNCLGEIYERNYGEPTTSNRLFATVAEVNAGKGPCYLRTGGISSDEEEELYKAYLNMAPAQTLRWLETGQGPAVRNVEIEGSEPYVVGGHTGSGYWVDTGRAATVAGLFAAGDVAGGSPQKYVTGCLAEGEIAAKSALRYAEDGSLSVPSATEIENRLSEMNRFFDGNAFSRYSVEDIEEAMQKTMDVYAGGISAGYAYNAGGLGIAADRIRQLTELAEGLKASDLHELMLIREVIDRLCVCAVLIRHLSARKETRWRSFQENRDYPERDDKYWLKYVNSRWSDGKVSVIFRSLVKKDEIYEHQD